MQLVQLSSDVMERVVSGDSGPLGSWASNATQEALKGHDMDGMVEQGYQYAREWLSGRVRSPVFP